MNQAFETKHVDTAVGISTHFQSAERLCTLDFLLGQTTPPEPLKSPLLVIAPAPTRPFPADAANLVRKVEIAPDMTFREASARWLSSLVSRRDNTEESYKRYVGSLELFFCDMKLRDIRIDHIVAYQKARVSGAEPFIRYRRPHDARPTKQGPAKGKTPSPAQPKKVNQEIGVLIRIVERAGLWSKQQSHMYKQVKLIEEIAEIPRALTPEEQTRWLETAMSQQRWQFVFWYSLLAFDTCMSTNEIRALRLQDINLPLRSVRVSPEGAKNKHRRRPIPIGDASALWALECLLNRARELGACQPDHYLLPGRVSIGKYNPAIPMSPSGIHSRWNEVRTASGIKWFRPYDTRHTAITRLAEAGVSYSLIMDRAGHVSKEMTQHYTHLSTGYVDQELQRAHQVYAMRSMGKASNAPGYGLQAPPMPYNPPVAHPPNVSYKQPVSYGTNRGWTGAGVFPMR